MITLFGKPEPTLTERLKASVSKTKAALSETVDTIFLGERKIDPSLLKDLEKALLSADLGVKPTREILIAERCQHAYHLHRRRERCGQDHQHRKTGQPTSSGKAQRGALRRGHVSG